MPALTFVISAHGFGHAARAAAVIDALAKRSGDLAVSVITTAPAWFFRESLTIPFNHIELPVDVGLVQRTSFDEDLPATIARLDELSTGSTDLVTNIAAHLRATGADLVVADIAPLGLAAARSAGVASLLQENFTWDWIYAAYRDQHPGIARHADAMASLFEQATHRVHCRPCCQAVAGGIAVEPVARRPRRDRPAVRRALGVAPDERLVLVTMGGVEFEFGALGHLAAHPGTVFVVPGGSHRIERRGHLIVLPHHSSFYHPSLVAAADLVVAKVGYSTLAECYQADTALVAIPRDRFPESPVLSAFAADHLHGRTLDLADFTDGNWLDVVDDVLAGMPDGRRVRANGADQIADLILDAVEGAPGRDRGGLESAR